MNNDLKLRRIVFKTSGVLLLIAAWQIFAASFAKKGMEMLLASPFQVIKRLFSLIFEPDFLRVVAGSSYRIFIGFIVAFVIGIILGSLAGEFDFIEDLLWPAVATVKAVPVAAFVVILFIWYNTEIIPILTFFIAFPVIYGNVLQGVKSADGNLVEVSEIYRISYLKRIVFIKTPAVSNYLISSSSTAIGMAWKAGVAAELIIQINGSIGEKIYTSKVNFLNEDLLAWTLVTIIVSIIFEKVFVLLLKLFFARFYKI